MRPCSYSHIAMCLLLLFTTRDVHAQQQDASEISPSYLVHIYKHNDIINAKLEKETKKILTRLEREDKRLLRLVRKSDSSAANFLSPTTSILLSKLILKEKSQHDLAYSGKLDSLITSLHLLSRTKTLIPNFDSLLSELDNVQSSLSKVERLLQYARIRREKINYVLTKSGLHRYLNRYNKKISKYSQKLKNLEDLVNNPSRIEEKVITTAAQSKAFKNFFAKHSQLALLFSLPGTESLNNIAPDGIQTRELLQESIADHFGKGTTVQQLLEANVPSAQSELINAKSRLLKNKKGKFSNISEHNAQPTLDFDQSNNRTFLQRLKYGANIQTQRATYYFPVTSDVALTLAYQISKNSLLGLGLSLKMGWGTDWKHILISYQGAGIRSNVDTKVIGSYYITAAYEQHYRGQRDNFSQMQSISRWSSSGLMGVKKTYSISKKFNGHVQILWDFLSYHNQTNTPPILFRMGYELK